MLTIIIDNYDSFTYNLLQYFEELKANTVLIKNDQLNIDQIKKLNPSHIVISPGPGSVEKREDFGICQEVILKLGPKIPLLGVCLGHQGIGYAFGGKIERAKHIMHGKTSMIEHDGEGLFKGIARPFKAMRYHSLCISRENLPEELIVTAKVKDEETIMAVAHKRYPIWGIQFHPESFQTPEGKEILGNFLEM